MIHYPKTVSPSFKKRANEAAFWEAWVGAVLARAGLYTLHHPFEADGGEHHALTWDLDVSDVGPDEQEPNWRHLECKSLSLTFNSPEDYPFDTALICSANSWERKWPDSKVTRRDFLLISRETGAIVWIPIGSKAVVTKVTDTTRGETYRAMRTTKKSLKTLWDFIEHVRA